MGMMKGMAWHGLTPAGLLLCFLLFCPAPVAVAKDGEAPAITLKTIFESQGGEKFLQTPLALALDPHNGDLVVSSFGANQIVILDKFGTLVRRIGREAGLISPYGVAVDDKGRIYVSEIDTGLLKILSPGGLLVDRIDLSALAGRPVAPGRITLGSDGAILVADLRNNTILLINDKGELERTFGTFVKLQKAVFIKDAIVGSSAYGDAMSFFDKKGTSLSSFGKHGDELDKNFSFPAGFAVDGKGRLWIADAFQHRLKVFSLKGKHLFNFGQLEEKGSGFFFPVDICFGSQGELLVLEKGGGRIQIFQVDDLHVPAKKN